jgi:hypothetical protein
MGFLYEWSAPLIVVADFTGHIPGRELHGVVHGEAHRHRRLDPAWRRAGDHGGERPE